MTTMCHNRAAARICFLVICALSSATICQCFSPPNAANHAFPSSRLARSTTLCVGTDIDGATRSEKSIVAALTKMETIMNPGFGSSGSSSSSLDRFHKSILSAVEIKESSIPGAGMGLFARKNLASASMETMMIPGRAA